MAAPEADKSSGEPGRGEQRAEHHQHPLPGRPEQRVVQLPHPLAELQDVVGHHHRERDHPQGQHLDGQAAENRRLRVRGAVQHQLDDGERAAVHREEQAVAPMLPLLVELVDVLPRSPVVGRRPILPQLPVRAPLASAGRRRELRNHRAHRRGRGGERRRRPRCAARGWRRGCRRG